MLETTKRAPWKNMRLLAMPVVIALMVALAFAVQAVVAGSPFVELVSIDDPEQNLATAPLNIPVGGTTAIDIMVELPADPLYAGEFHFRIGGDVDEIVKVLDAWPEPRADFNRDSTVNGDQALLEKNYLLCSPRLQNPPAGAPVTCATAPPGE